MTKIASCKTHSLEQLADVIAANAYFAYSHSLSAALAPHAPPHALQFFDWCTNPQPGQLVLEISTHSIRPSIDRLGVLQWAKDLPYDNWEEEEVDGSAPCRTVYRIERLTGEVIDWENCQLIAVRATPGFAM